MTNMIFLDFSVSPRLCGSFLAFLIGTRINADGRGFFEELLEKERCIRVFCALRSPRPDLKVMLRNDTRNARLRSVSLFRRFLGRSDMNVALR